MSNTIPPFTPLNIWNIVTQRLPNTPSEDFANALKQAQQNAQTQHDTQETQKHAAEQEGMKKAQEIQQAKNITQTKIQEVFSEQNQKNS